jgi:hypothetical protein
MIPDTSRRRPTPRRFGDRRGAGFREAYLRWRMGLDSSLDTDGTLAAPDR